MIRTATFCIIFFLNFFAYTQVGIGTTEPTTDLEVKGHTVIQGNLKTAPLEFVTTADENFKLLTRLTSSQPVGSIGVLDVSQLQVAPVNVINYHFKNINRDNLRDVNLQYNAEKYVVGLSNFRYVGDPIRKQTKNNRSSVGNFVTRLFIENSTWHLEIQNRNLDLELNKSIEYHVSLVIYDKSYYRNLPEIKTNLQGSNTGSASAIPNLY